MIALTEGADWHGEEVALAGALLEEWNQGKGTSKSAIERRVWGDGGAHGRHFDRFILEKLGIVTTRSSKQTDRIGEFQGKVDGLEAQIKRLGAVPQGAALEEWEEQLRHGRHAALAALRVWNDPTASFRTETFSLLFVAAWNSIALAILQRDGQEWRQLEHGERVPSGDGGNYALDTRELLARALPGDGYLALRRNVEFWIGLRNRVAHRHLAALDAVVIPQAQAGLLNLEGILSEKFGENYLLADHLTVPLQLSGFRDPGVLASLKRLQAALPLDVQAYLTRSAAENEDLLNNPSYALRVAFVPVVPASGRHPDSVVYFVRPDEVPADLEEALQKFIVVPKLIKTASPRLIAKQVVEGVEARIRYKFTINMHIEAARRLGVRPTVGVSPPAQPDARYCEYVSSVKRYFYNQAWIERLVEKLATPEGFREATGREPVPKEGVVGSGA